MTKQLPKRDSKLLGILFCRRGLRPNTDKSDFSIFRLWMYTEIAEIKLQIRLNPAIMEETGNNLLPPCSKGPYRPLHIHLKFQKIHEYIFKRLQKDLHVPMLVSVEA